MCDPDLRLAFDLGQRVCRATEPSGRVGYLVAVMLAAPYEGLVRWSNDEATFEPLDDLVEALPVARQDHGGAHAEGSNRSAWPAAAAASR